MMESINSKKTKIALSDYNYRKDIENRLVMAQFTTEHQKVLEEILYSPIKVSIKKLAANTDLSVEELMPILQNFAKTGLLIIDKEDIVVDKEMRKYYESQMQKFEEDFKPGMEYFQCLLKKVPIHVLPNWYAIPRTSNNIVESIVEKYLYTPQIYQRYLTELSFNDPNIHQIVNMVFASDDLKITSQKVMEELKITKELFEEYMLLLEFSCVCCLGYENYEGKWEEIITPFQEWKDYLQFLKKTDVHPIQKINDVMRYLPDDFSFVKDMGLILQTAKKQPIVLINTADDAYEFDSATLKEFAIKAKLSGKEESAIQAYFHKVFLKLLLLKLCDIVNGKLYAVEAADYFLDMKPEARALFIYRHPLNKVADQKALAMPTLEKALRECEKSIVRVLGKGWVVYEDFLKGVIAPLGENSAVVLKKTGKSWRYMLPEYTEEEKNFIRACILEWLLEAGITATGTYQGNECFTVTAFGCSLFSR